MSMLTTHFARSDEEQRERAMTLRRQIAERKIKESRRAELLAQLAAIDREVDEATDQHSRDCEPIQAELREIEQRQIDDLAEGRPKNEPKERQRKKLLATLSSHNEALEESIARADRLRKPIDEELRPLTKTIAEGAALENQLRQCAPLPLHGKHWAARRSLTLYSNRLQEAISREALARDELQRAQQEPRKYDLLQFARRHMQWESELQVAQAAFGEAQAVCRELEAQMLGYYERN